MSWMIRGNRNAGVRGQRSGVRDRKATWAGVALSVLSLLAQVGNFIRVDLQPVLSALSRIEQRIEDHERRIAELERRGAGAPVRSERSEAEREARAAPGVAEEE